MKTSNMLSERSQTKECYELYDFIHKILQNTECLATESMVAWERVWWDGLQRGSTFEGDRCSYYLYGGDGFIDVFVRTHQVVQ